MQDRVGAEALVVLQVHVRSLDDSKDRFLGLFLGMGIGNGQRCYADHKHQRSLDSIYLHRTLLRHKLREIPQNPK